MKCVCEQLNCDKMYRNDYNTNHVYYCRLTRRGNFLGWIVKFNNYDTVLSCSESIPPTIDTLFAECPYLYKIHLLCRLSKI